MLLSLFKLYGVDKRACLVDDTYYDENIMVLDLNGDGRGWTRIGGGNGIY